MLITTGWRVLAAGRGAEVTPKLFSSPPPRLFSAMTAQDEMKKSETTKRIVRFMVSPSIK
jgi:hypothetical protein